MVTWTWVPFGPFSMLATSSELRLSVDLAIDGGNHVAWTDAGPVGWRSLKRKDHHDLLRGSDSLRLDRHPDAVVLAVLVFAHLRVGLRVIEAGVRIEGAQHPRDGAVVDHLAGLVAGQRIGVILRDQVVDIGEGAKIVAKGRIRRCSTALPPSGRSSCRSGRRWRKK